MHVKHNITKTTWSRLFLTWLICKLEKINYLIIFIAWDFKMKPYKYSGMFNLTLKVWKYIMTYRLLVSSWPTNCGNFENAQKQRLWANWCFMWMFASSMIQHESYLSSTSFTCIESVESKYPCSDTTIWLLCIMRVSVTRAIADLIETWAIVETSFGGGHIHWLTKRTQALTERGEIKWPVGDCKNRRPAADFYRPQSTNLGLCYKMHSKEIIGK